VLAHRVLLVHKAIRSESYSLKQGLAKGVPTIVF